MECSQFLVPFSISNYSSLNLQFMKHTAFVFVRGEFESSILLEPLLLLYVSCKLLSYKMQILFNSRVLEQDNKNKEMIVHVCGAESRPWTKQFENLVQMHEMNWIQVPDDQTFEISENNVSGS